MYRLVDCDTWSDAWFEGLEPQGKLFFLYLLTNPRSTSCGAFEITPRKMAFETQLDQTDIERWLHEWAPRVQWWPEHQIVFVRNFYRRQFNSEKVKINAQRLVAELPPEVRAAIYEAYPDWRPADDTLSASTEEEHTLPIPYADPSHKQNGDVTETRRNETIPPLVSPPGGSDEPDPPPKPKAPRGKRLPEDWTVSPELRAWTRERFGWSDSEIDAAAEEFRDYWRSVTTRRVDWDLTWKNRVRQLNDRRPRVPPHTNGAGAPADPAMVAWLEVVRVKEHQRIHNRSPDEPVPAAIYDAVVAVGGWNHIDPSNDYHRRDFLQAYRATSTRHDTHHGLQGAAT